MLARNAGTRYLSRYGSPRDERAFRDGVPIVSYEDLSPWLESIQRGASDVLFVGRPAAYERTGGSSGGSKLIPYSSEGLEDFRRALLPWLVEGARSYGVGGRVYLSISPATREPETIGNIPVGLPDGAYLGAAAATILADLAAVPFTVAEITDEHRWRAVTLQHLAAASDLELISCWSPTFLLRLLDELPDPTALWPRLKLVSCWASAQSQPFAAEVAKRLPQARLQAKGLMSTECVVTVPGAAGRSVLTSCGFFEFERKRDLFLAHELERGGIYAVVATTASGLYRYRTGDLVRCDGHGAKDRPILEFIGRGSLSSDLVGEKLTEPFVADCLSAVPGFRMLVPTSRGDGYALATSCAAGVDARRIEESLCRNPQYAFARRMGQLRPLRVVEIAELFERYIDIQLRQGVLLGDIKPVALRTERAWLSTFGVSA
jgi:hypothetical protein